MCVCVCVRPGCRWRWAKLVLLMSSRANESACRFLIGYQAEERTRQGWHALVLPRDLGYVSGCLFSLALSLGPFCRAWCPLYGFSCQVFNMVGQGGRSVPVVPPAIPVGTDGLSGDEWSRLYFPRHQLGRMAFPSESALLYTVGGTLCCKRPYWLPWLQSGRMAFQSESVPCCTRPDGLSIESVPCCIFRDLSRDGWPFNRECPGCILYGLRWDGWPSNRVCSPRYSPRLQSRRMAFQSESVSLSCTVGLARCRERPPVVRDLGR